MKRLLILGATGSIGLQALDVVARAGEEFELVGLSAERSHERLVALAEEHGVSRIALGDADAAARAAEAWTEGEVLAGPEGLVRLVTESGADLVLNAIVGSAGLGPTVVALTEGIDVALANKESLVVGGDLVMPLAEATGAQLIPVDSEHSALHQLIAGEAAGAVDRLVITASGGPFRGRSRAELEDVSVEDALQHPTWAMGGKITIDSATLMNKGLEVIEAHHLFGTPYDRIDVVVHPQSIVHGMVQLCDGASLAHLGHPDMRVPIAYALHHPERVDVPVPALDLAQVGSLTFEPPDLEAFPALGLAFAAARAGGTAPCVLNAANEVAVHAFLGERLGFMGIPAVIEGTLEQLPGPHRALVRVALRGRRRGAPDRRRARGPGGARVSWFLAFAGFAALIILHELGHFAAAKAVGMRVERFSLFFGRTKLRWQRGETEYGVGWLPLGGFVKITGMNPVEEIPPEVAHRAYYRQPVWKRLVVIAAGPAVNIFLAFVILMGLYWSIGDVRAGQADQPDRGDDAGLARRGRRSSPATGSSPSTAAPAPRPRCASRSPRTAARASRRQGCKAAEPAVLVIQRGDARITAKATPVYNAAGQAPAARLRVRRHAAPPIGPRHRRRAERRQDVVLHQRHGQHDRPDLQGREAQGGLGRGRLLRGDAQEHRGRARSRRSSCSR